MQARRPALRCDALSARQAVGGGGPRHKVRIRKGHDPLPRFWGPWAGSGKSCADWMRGGATPDNPPLYSVECSMSELIENPYFAGEGYHE